MIGTHQGGEFRVTQLIKQIHRFTITVATHDDMPDVVHNTAQLKGSRLAAKIFILKVM